MKQYSKSFYRDYNGDPKVDRQLNAFLAENPNYSVSHIVYNKEGGGKCCESLFVVFNVDEEFISNNAHEDFVVAQTSHILPL